MSLKTPIVFIIFNRPKVTQKVFEEIAKAKPEKLLVIADGPRPNYPSDIKKCRKTRAIIENVDWNCEVLKNYSETNLGCRKRVSSGLNWAFDQVEEAIILEDDCLPHPSFFKFCQELLDKYRNDERVAVIYGTNILYRWGSSSYFFSRCPQGWGWATWKRFWKHYDVDIKDWANLRNTDWVEKVVGKDNPILCEYRRKVFDEVYQGKADTADYQITFAALKTDSLFVIPKVNLVSNIGFSEGATHTRQRWHKFANLKQSEMKFPLLHPSKVCPDTRAEKLITRYQYTPFRPFLIRAILYLIYRIRRWFYEQFKLKA